MELLMWLMEIEIWRLQRKEHETMANDKITGDPKAPTDIYCDPYALEMYQRATDRYRQAAKSGDIVHWVQSVPEWYQNEVVVRVIDDAKHGRR